MKKLVIGLFLIIMFGGKAQTLQFTEGDKALNFSAITHAGTQTELKKLTKNGSVVMIFYRGY